MCFSFTFLDFIVRVYRKSFNMYHLLTHDPTLGVAVFNGECLNCLIQYNTIQILLANVTKPEKQGYGAGAGAVKKQGGSGSENGYNCEK